MNLEEITYSTKPLTLGEHILVQRAGKGDYEAIAAYIAARTDLTSEQILDLDDDELLIIVKKLNEAIMNSIVLQQIARTLDAGE